LWSAHGEVAPILQGSWTFAVRLLFLSFDYLTRPLGIASLTAALQRAGHDAEVAALGDRVRQEALLHDCKPHFLCLSLITGRHPLFIERAWQIRAAQGT
jgi:hypothetical protein